MLVDIVYHFLQVFKFSLRILVGEVTSHRYEDILTSLRVGYVLHEVHELQHLVLGIEG